jgi:predicted transposase YdaD
VVPLRCRFLLFWYIFACRSTLFHAEAQGSGGGDLAERMNHYRCLIYAHYRKEPVALAIVTDGHRKAERVYAHSHYGTKAIYEYNYLALAELDDEELLAGDNPIDLVLYAAKTSAQTKEELQRYNYLRTLARLLGERNKGDEEKRDLLLFIQRILYIRDEKLIERYREYRRQLDKEGKIMYDNLSFLEEYEIREAKRLVREEGWLEGKQAGKQEGWQLGQQEGWRQGQQAGWQLGKEEMARNLLANGVPLEIVAKSAGLPPDRIQGLLN